MSRYRLLLTAGAFAALVGLAALDSSAQAQPGGKGATLKGKVTFDGTPPPKGDISIR